MPENNDIDLPEKLFVPLAELPAKNEPPSLLKATSPDGRSMAIAFTKLEYLEHFSKETGHTGKNGRLPHIVMPTSALLDELTEAGEPDICVNPLQEDEAILSYNRRGALSRQTLEHGEVMEVHEPPEALPADHLQKLVEVAEALPTVEQIWLMELQIKKHGSDKVEDARPLLVVKQRLAEGDDEFSEAFMELGDRWCELLPRGSAVDMLPHTAPPVAGQLADKYSVYKRV